MLRILNIIVDEKFIDNVIECHDIFSEKVYHDYVIVGQKNEAFKYIKRFVNRVHQISNSEFSCYLKNNKFDAVFLHSFFIIDPKLIINIPKQIKVFWFSWGYDLYSYLPKPFININLLGPETEIIKKKTEQTIVWSKKLKSFIKDITFYNNYKNRCYYKAVSRIDYFSGVLDFEYSLMKKVPEFRAEKVTYTYNSIPVMNFADSGSHWKGRDITKNNILIGNSADYSNNHLDILKYFKNIDIGYSVIYLPLSYSGELEYVDYVKSKYSERFGRNFVSMDTFIPYSEYTEIISSCSVAIFAHERQQAIGNICAAFRNGSKVFLSETNDVYKYYKDLGMTVFSLQHDFNQEELNTPLADELVEKNIQILNVRASRNTYIKDMNYIFDCINKK